MIADAPPKNVAQWDRRNEVLDAASTAMSFCYADPNLTTVLNNPRRYVM